MRYFGTRRTCTRLLICVTTILIIAYINNCIWVLFQLYEEANYLIDLRRDSLQVVIEKLKQFDYDELEIYNELRRRKRNRKSDDVVLRYTGDNETAKLCSPSPSTSYEITRRAIENGIKEFYYFVTDTLKNNKRSLRDSLQLIAEHKRSLLNDVDRLAETDGYEQWRIQEHQELSSVVQNRLNKLQNPLNCSQTKKIACSLNLNCGFGCQIHHVVYCLIIGYGTQREVVFEQNAHWSYFQTNWEDVFEPLSKACESLPKDFGEEVYSMWPHNKNAEILHLPLATLMTSPPDFMPLAIPADIADRLIRLHGNPFAWWVGQILKYVLRPDDNMANLLEDQSRIRGKFRKPIVGVHVRRTDKLLSEAKLYEVDEYMTHVEDYYEQLSMKETVEIRRVYLASDEILVLREAINKYPEYSFVFRTNNIYESHSVEALYRIVFDIHFLSRCDYLVCTFSSNVCRLAYALMQTLRPDASSRFRSLDDIYYFDGQRDNYYQVILPHRPTLLLDEIELQVGDRISVAGNHWDGFSKGTNKRTGKTGLFPSFKVRHQVKVVEFP